MYRSGADLGRFAQGFLSHLRDLVVARVVAEPDALLEMGDEDRQRVREQAARAESPVLQALFEQFGRAAEDVVRSQTPRLALEAAVLLCEVLGRAKIAPPDPAHPAANRSKAVQ